MKISIPTTKKVEVEVKFVRVVIPIAQDGEATEIPLMTDSDLWDAVINLETGVIEGWPEGETAEIYEKVRDSGSYYLLDENREVVTSIEGDYVPHDVIPGKYGDYVIMKIDGSGAIESWDVQGFDDFLETKD